MPVSFFFTRNFGKEGRYLCRDLTMQRGLTCRADGCGSAGSAKVPWGNVPDVETGEYDCVAAKEDRPGRKDGSGHFSLAMFYKVTKISMIEFVEGARDYRLMTRKMRDAVLAGNLWHLPQIQS